jgi:regulator of replication initiation timing
MSDDDDLQARVDELERLVQDLEARIEALNRARMHFGGEIDDLQAENEELRDRLTTLEAITAPERESHEYDQLTRSQKVTQLRRKLVTIAANRNGKAAMDYNDVQTHFDGRPSPDHCYTLMKLAAGYDEDTDRSSFDGFRYDKHGGANERLLVNLDALTDEPLIRTAKKASTGGEV